MTSLFQKKYIKIPIVVLVIFSIFFRFFPPPKESRAIEIVERPKIDYLDICEPKVPFYDEALQTDELQEACYLLKKIQDRTAQIVTIARKMYESTNPLDECNPLWGEKFPYITEGTCKSSCAWGLPNFTVSIDLTVVIICAFAPQLCAALVTQIGKILEIIDKVLEWKWVWDLWKAYKYLKALYEIYENFTELLQDLNTLTEKIRELLELIPSVDLSELNEFYDTLVDLMLIKYEIQGELTTIEGKIYQMENIVGRFTPEQLEGIFRLINEIGEVFAEEILAPGQSLGEGFASETLRGIKEAAENLTCGEHCDNIKNLATNSIVKNDEIQQILYEFYQTDPEERLGTMMMGMSKVICQTKDKIFAILSTLTEIENEISQASDSNYLDDIQDGIDEIKPVFEELSDKISQLESGQAQTDQGEEPWSPEESCRMYDHFYLLEKLGKIIAILRATSKKVDALVVDLDASDEQIRKDSQIIRERLEEIKNELDKIRVLLIDFGVAGANIDEAKTELDEIKPKIDELEETALQAMGVINLLKGIKLIKEIIDLIKEVYQEAKDLVDKIVRVLEGDTGDELKEIRKKLEDFKKELDKMLKGVKSDTSIEMSDIRDGIRCLPATGIYGKYKAEDSKEIPCPMPAWWREETCTTNDDCDEDRVCRWWICRRKCDADDDCDPNYICEEEACIPPSASKYIGGRVCSDLKVPFNQLSGAFASVIFNLNKIRDIKRDGHPEVEPVETKAFQLWERALYVQAWAIFLRYMTDNCLCGRSYCRLTFGVSGISFPGCFDPLLNPYCWLAWWPARNWLQDEADKLENINSE